MTPAPSSTPNNTPITISQTKNSAIERTQENFRTVHGLMCRSWSRARRGPRGRAARARSDPIPEPSPARRESGTRGTDPVAASAALIGVEVQAGGPDVVGVDPHGGGPVGVERGSGRDAPAWSSVTARAVEGAENPVVLIGAACPLWGDCVMITPVARPVPLRCARWRPE